MLPLADLHYHALPGVDDGAPDFETALAMLSISYAEGVRAICLTPHRGPKGRMRREERIAAFEELSRIAKEKFPELAVYLGEELWLDSSTAEELKSGEAATLGGTPYVLLEFPTAVSYEVINHALHRLQTMGYTPVLAHAERYGTLLRHPYLVRELRDMRALIQVNAYAIASRPGFRVRHFVRWLLRERLVDAVASDAHDALRRPPALLAAYRKTEKLCGAEYARAIFYTNPLRYMTEKER